MLSPRAPARSHSTRLVRLLFQAGLALPGVLMLADWQSGRVLALELTEPSGLLAVRLMVAALLAGPVTAFFGLNGFTRGWLAVRRNLGVAAFTYALLHLWFYAADLGAIAPIVAELELPGIWTGWLALAFLLPPAVTSNDRLMRALRRRWKPLQRLVYAALAFAFVHWLLLEWNPGTAALHLAPLLLAWPLRLWRRLTPTRRTP